MASRDPGRDRDASRSRGDARATDHGLAPLRSRADALRPNEGPPLTRRGGRRTGRLGARLALICGGSAFLGCGLLVVMMAPVDQRQWLLGGVASVVVGAVVAMVAWMQGGQIGSRLTDLGLAVSKLGRGG